MGRHAIQRRQDRSGGRQNLHRTRTTLSPRSLLIPLIPLNPLNLRARSDHLKAKMKDYAVVGLVTGVLDGIVNSLSNKIYSMIVFGAYVSASLLPTFNRPKSRTF
jgi:hypothetical protein